MNPHRILVVDGDLAVHELLTSAFPPPQWQLESFHDAASGLARLQAVPFDVFLVNIDLPGLDRPDLLSHLRAAHPRTHVLLLTATARPADVIHAIRERAFAYLSKPFTASTLTELIHQAPETSAWPEDICVESGRPGWVTLRARCHSATADRIVQFVRELEADLPAAVREDILAAFRELLMNAVEHGCHNDPGEWVRVSVLRGARAAIYHIQDPGPGFSFEDIPHAAVSNPPDAPVQHLSFRAEQGVRPGGFGILLTRNLVDDLLYNQAGNEVVFVKYL